jgi:Domain of unknown function (DUF397)
MAASVPQPSPSPAPAEGVPLFPRDRPAPPAWRRSSFSTGADQTCVEVAITGGDRAPEVLLRDSKDPGGPVLRFTAAEWRVFLRGVLAGEFAIPGSPPPDHDSSASRAASSADDCAGSAATRPASASAST